VVFVLWIQHSFKYFEGFSGGGEIQEITTTTEAGKRITLKRCSPKKTSIMILILAFAVLSAGFAAWLPVCNKEDEIKKRKYWLIVPIIGGGLLMLISIARSYKKNTKNLPKYLTILTILSTLIVTLCSLGFIIA